MNKKYEILIAEDEEHIAKLIEFKLSREGYKVTIAKNGQEALDQLNARSWSLLILDVMLPIFDGWKVLATLKNELKSSIPVLMLTAKSQRKDITHAAELGATQFLKKPFDPSELVLRVKEIVEA